MFHGVLNTWSLSFKIILLTQIQLFLQLLMLILGLLNSTLIFYRTKSENNMMIVMRGYGSLHKYSLEIILKFLFWQDCMISYILLLMHLILIHASILLILSLTTQLVIISWRELVIGILALMLLEKIFILLRKFTGKLKEKLKWDQYMFALIR